MITLELRIGGNGPAHFVFNSGLIAAVHVIPPGDGTGLAVQIGNLQSTALSLAPGGGVENIVYVDINEGQDPVWLAFSIDCTGGGAVGVGFPGSPTVRVNPGSYLWLEYNNGKPAPAPPASQEFARES